MDKVLEFSLDLLYFEAPLVALFTWFLGLALLSSESKREKIVFVDISIFFLALFMCLNFTLWMTLGVIMKEDALCFETVFVVGTGGLISLLIYLSSLLTHEE